VFWCTKSSLDSAPRPPPPDPLSQYRLGVAQALAGQGDAAAASFAKVQGKHERLARLWTVHIKQKAAPAPAAGN
jgi:hypothetical protein